MKKIYLLCLLAFGWTYAQNPADRDPSFNPFNLPLGHYYVNNAEALQVKVQPDNKILLIHPNDQEALVRLDGNIKDNSFVAPAFNGPVYDATLQPDGKMIVVGDFTQVNGQPGSGIVRLNADGSRDLSFLGTGFNNFPYHAVLQPDGKILVNGIFTQYNGTACNRLVRLNANGTLDASFNCGTDPAFGAGVRVLSGGKILSLQPLIKRLNTNGTIDATFNSGTGFNNSLSDAIEQPDGKIIVIGVFTSYNGIPANGVIRLNADGSVDTTFSSGTGFSSSGNSAPSILHLQADGKILIAGSLPPYNNAYTGNFIRLNPDGSRDNSFLGSSFVGGTGIHSVGTRADGKMVVSGAFKTFQGIGVDGLVQLNADGSRDTSFDNKGAGFDNAVTAMGILSNGKILLGGDFITYNGEDKRKFLGLNADGSFDTDFNHNLGTNFNAQLGGMPKVIKSTPDGKIIIGGTMQNFAGTAIQKIVRLNADGTLDNNFDYTQGFTGLGYPAASESAVKVIAFEADGNMLVAGTFNSHGGNSNSGLVRLYPNGYRDFSFNVSLSESSVADIMVQPDGKILVCGAFTSCNNTSVKGIVRLNPNGTRDAAFVLDAAIAFPSLGFIKIMLMADGKIVLQKAEVGGLIRINADGSLDTTFDEPDAPFSIPTAYLMQPDGKILRAAYGAGDQYFVQRLNADGSVDATFDQSTGFNNTVEQMAFQPDGKIIAVGSFDKYGGLPERRIVRLMGEEFYFVQGNNTIDANSNGCDASDPALPSLALQVSNGLTLFADTTGNYSVTLPEGSYTLTPVFENPAFFTASPASISVDFPSQANPVSQNFCITPNGTHHDLEVTLVPIGAARPGFDANYKLIYKNKGNQTENGSVSLVFNEATLDFVSSAPVTASQTPGLLNWNFSNLHAFESREMAITLNLNSPMETPPLNSNDVLGFTAAVNYSADDESPSDNTFVLQQTVVNSLDPNDKTCLEGRSISISQVGDYVHYVIRFENTGTYPAQNVVVRDVIDTDKYEIASLRPTGGSHLFVTKITEGNKVEFVFENINLPFDNTNNDGYVAFKIKTKSNLTNGETFTNLAGIYFDFNYPVMTNEAATVVGTLGTQQFEFEPYFTIYPNPADQMLNLYNKQNISVESIEIYNSMGQLNMIIPDARGRQSIDISPLKTGTYFIKLHAEKGTSFMKFIKK